MTTTLVPGDSVTWLKSGVTFANDESLIGTSHVSQRGRVLTLTSKLIESNRDRSGIGLFDIVDDEAEQVRKYGEVLLAPGSIEISAWTPGTVEQELARAERKRQAFAQVEPDKQAEALRAVVAEFGPPPSDQTSSWMPGDAERRDILRREGRAV